MSEKDTLRDLCMTGLTQKGHAGEPQWIQRLSKELKDIDAQGENEYFIKLHNRFRLERLMFPINEHNNLVDYVLDLAPTFDITKESAFVQGESPDIDIDYLKFVRDYLKRIWAAKTFGQEKICEIGTYGTSGIKSAIKDVARVYSCSSDEINNITSKMEDKFQDDDGNTQDLEWEDALKIYPEFKAYCERYPEVARDAEFQLDRNKSGGVHAGGLVISSVDIDGFVPLEVRSVTKDNPLGVICAAWTEGLKRQDLGPVGLIKFDLLVINNLLQIAIACKLIKERHGITSICAMPGDSDWSDISYLNDPKLLAMANNADTKCIFQFGSEGIRKLLKRSGVTCFDDIPAISSLYRPGPLGMGMDVHYCKRKKWSINPADPDGEPYNIHPKLRESLGYTYGVMCYQEQVMDILRIVGLIPDMHTEKVRKAISKKKIEQFGKYKDQFIKNGQEVLGVNEDYVKDLWDQIESFAEYGFNKSVDECTLIPFVGGVKEIQDFVPGDRVYCVNGDGKTVETEVVALHDHGELEGFEVTFDDGYQVTCSANHKFLTENGQVSLREICRTGYYIFVDQNIEDIYATEKNRWMEDTLQSRVSKQKRISLSSDELRSVQGSKKTTKVREVEVYCSMWRENVNTRENVGASEGLSTMSSISMEEIDRNSYSTMWNGVSNLERTRESFEKLRCLQSNQTKQYRSQNEQVEQRQFGTREKEDILGNCSQNFDSIRTFRTTSSQFKEMERRESREVCQMHRISLEKSETFPNGSLASKSIKLGDETDTLWRRTQASGFCERQYLDRNRWILSFLQSSKKTSITHCSSQRPDVERGMHKERQCNASEIEYGMFQTEFWRDEDRDLELGAGHAPITNTGNLVHRKVVRVVPVGKCHMFDLEVANPTHNFLLPNGIVTSNSHSYAYSYISARLLWLKAHYPLEFYAAILQCEDEVDKYKDIKLDAMRHGVEVLPVHINKSKENFEIHENKIYFGFQNIKTIGENVAKRIVENQPYKNFVDFLDRFGTDASPIKALVALGVFEEKHDRVTMRKFSEIYKKQVSARKDRQKRNEASVSKRDEELRALLHQEVDSYDPEMEQLCQFTDEAEALWIKRFAGIMREVPYKYKGEERTREVTYIKQLQDLKKKRQSSIDLFNTKEQADDKEEWITFDNVNFNSVSLDEAEEALLMDELVLGDWKTYPKAESQYYGFQWVHRLETHPDYQGRTLTKFLDEHENQAVQDAMVEVEIKTVKRRESKPKGDKKPVEFYSIEIEDADGKRMYMNIWMDDYTRFQDDLKVGNLVKMRVRPPGGGFNTLTFESVPRNERRKLPAKELDPRLQVMKCPELEVVKDDDSVLDDLKFNSVLIPTE